MTALNEWLKKKRKAMPFAVPMIWREPTDHVNNCYLSHAFYEKRFNGKKKSSIEYPDIPSAIHPVPHSDQLPIPESCEIDLLCSDDAESSEMPSIPELCISRNKEFGIITSKPHLINESELNDLVRDLDLPKVKAEQLISKSKQWNLLQSGVNVYGFRTRQQSFAQFFSMKGELVYCTDVDGIMLELGNSHKPEEWRLFIDSSKLSLIAVLLNNGNMLP